MRHLSSTTCVTLWTRFLYAELWKLQSGQPNDQVDNDWLGSAFPSPASRAGLESEFRMFLSGHCAACFIESCFLKCNNSRLVVRGWDLSRLKCNREKPCQNCIVRGESNAISCTYADKAGGKHLAKLNPRSNPEDMRQRIDRLEKSILSVISTDASNVINKPGSPAAHVTDDEQTDEDDNPHEVGQKISVDTRSTHWDAILNEVRAAKSSLRDAVANIWSNNNKLGAMKDAWSEENDGSETSSRHQSSKNFRPSLLTGLTQPPKRSVVMASLPFRDAADKLVNRFFTYVNPAVPAKCKLRKLS